MYYPIVMSFIEKMPQWGQMLFYAIVIVLCAVIALKAGVFILRKVLKKWLNFPIIYPTIKSAWIVLVYIYATSMFLQYVLHISPSTLLAAIGISGLTIGIGLQGFVKDVVAGVMLIANPSFKVGDNVVVKNIYSGVVHKITLVNTHLKTSNGEDIFLSNSEITAVEVKHDVSE